MQEHRRNVDKTLRSKEELRIESDIRYSPLFLVHIEHGGPMIKPVHTMSHHV
jgi:hypothetical protein